MRRSKYIISLEKELRERFGTNWIKIKELNRKWIQVNLRLNEKKFLMKIRLVSLIPTSFVLEKIPRMIQETIVNWIVGDEFDLHKDKMMWCKKDKVFIPFIHKFSICNKCIEDSIKQGKGRTFENCSEFKNLYILSLKNESN